MWDRGVYDDRPVCRYGMVQLLGHALQHAIAMIRKMPCEHKIGMCRCPHVRWEYYNEKGSEWSPWLLVLLASTTTREGASMMEASLILQLEDKEVNIANNINWTTSMDYGGEGYKPANESDLEHFVYLAVRPLAMRPEDMALLRSFRPHEGSFGERAAAASAHQQLEDAIAAASAHQHDEPLGERAA